jgi:hypothetical protein
MNFNPRGQYWTRRYSKANVYNRSDFAATFHGTSSRPKLLQHWFNLPAWWSQAPIWVYNAQDSGL